MCPVGGACGSNCQCPPSTPICDGGKCRVGGMREVESEGAHGKEAGRAERKEKAKKPPGPPWLRQYRARQLPCNESARCC